jgi:riboflavin transporter FmnP
MSALPNILTHGFALMAIFAIPILVGLVWNKWAGGAAGVLLGTLDYVAYAGYYTAMINSLPTYNMFRDPSFIGNYILGGMLIGYIAGALNNRSFSFKRMLGAGMTAAIIVGMMQFILNYTVSFSAYMTQGDPFYAWWTTMLPMVILGVIGPVVAKVMTWYGLYPARN